MPDTDADASILVVDDETSVADAYALQLGSRYGTVHTEYGGPEALEFLEHDGADVVLLDRRMPKLSGDEVLAEVREREYGCRVIMVTAVDPDFEVLEMDFDDYLQKPIDKEDLFAAVEQQLYAEDLEGDLSEYFSVRSKLAVLEGEMASAQLEDNEKYRRLRERAEALESDLGDEIDEFEEIASSFADIGRT